jgi:hypothetical protein
MAPPRRIDPEVLEDLKRADQCRALFAEIGSPLDFWEALSLVKLQRELVHEEVRRVRDLRAGGVPAGVARAVLDKLKSVRARYGLLVKDIREFMARLLEGPQEGDELEFTVALIVVSDKGRESAARWIADPDGQMEGAAAKIKSLTAMVRGYRTAMAGQRPSKVVSEKFERAEFAAEAVPSAPAAAAPASAPPSPVPPSAAPATGPASVGAAVREPEAAPVPAPASPPEPPQAAPVARAPEVKPKPPEKVELPRGVDPDVLEDVKRVEQCREIFKATHQQIEVWEVFCLVMLDRDATRQAVDELLRLKESGDKMTFNEGALTLFEILLGTRAQHGKFVRKLRDYLGSLPVGNFGKEIMEMALGFIVVSERGRTRAEMWMEQPEAYKMEACGRLEALISTVMNYQTALRMTASA